jgi:hypothetical protein
MKIRRYLPLFLFLSIAKTYGMKQISFKVIKGLNKNKTAFKSFSTRPFNNFKKSSQVESIKKDAPLDQKIATPQQSWWSKLTSFFSFNKATQPSTLDTIPHTDFAKIKFKTAEEENNTRDPEASYWNWKKWLAGTIGAALVGSSITQINKEKKEKNNDQLSQPEFEELRKFIEFVRDPELEKRWNACKENKECHEVILNANLITIINKKPYMVIKDSQFERVINAKLAEKVIAENDLNLIAVPKKTILFDGKSWKVVTQKIDGKGPTELSLEQVQQMTQFALETGYWDWKFGNLIFDKKSGKLFIIDTEDRSFAGGFSPIKELLYCLDTHRLDLFKDLKPLDHKIIKWLKAKEKIVEDFNKPFRYGNKLPPPLSKNPILNNSFKGFDIAEVRLQAKIYYFRIGIGRDQSLKGVRQHIEIN